MHAHQDKIKALRDALRSAGLDGLLVMRADRFQGEEVRPEDEYLSWLTGFTGSAGFALVLTDRTAIFSDSRYSVQMKQQVDTNIYQIFDTAQTSLGDWLASQHADNTLKIGFDSWCMTVSGHEKLPERLANQSVEWVAFATNLLNSIWTDRPENTSSDVFFLSKDKAGMDASEKINQVAASLQNNHCDHILVTHVDCVNWLTNIRARDLCHTPFCLCYCLIDSRGCLRLIGDKELSGKTDYGLVEWAELEGELSRLKGTRLECDPDSLPMALADMLDKAGVMLDYRSNEMLIKKACKNSAEIEGFRNAHNIDGLALCHFWYWLETQAQKLTVHESELAQKLSSLRAQSPGYICDSFATIAGYGANGAIVHYRAIAGQDNLISGSDILLLDSGAHYDCGTTDITRTLFLSKDGSKPHQEQVSHATAVLAGHINLAQAVFAKGTTGAQLDAICRVPMWQQGLDFGHGTGHGVGHILSVHEGPVSISKRCQLAILPGMVLSNEPGFYKESAYGIRHENLILCFEKSDGFLAFETLTCFPFDTRLIDRNKLGPEQLNWLNHYHRWVAESLTPDLPPEIAIWLEQKCRPL